MSVIFYYDTVQQQAAEFLEDLRDTIAGVQALRKLINYDSATGGLEWLHRPRHYFQSNRIFNSWNAKWAGKPAFTSKDHHGYFNGRIFGRTYLAHRVAFALENGAWPIGEIDHVNGNRADNRIANLRVVTRSENARNMGLSRANKSGCSGVYWSVKGREWRAQIAAGGKKVAIGGYQCLDDAIAARRLAEARAGYHPNHGGRCSQLSADLVAAGLVPGEGA
ncbi:HNH endonuclease signature motif containing protein [Sphingobium sp. AntQ-1]|uniref:HNH endonuclease signature motif containing protein n=1 Tax=Sphingobium sp. AntQ-1 TaxID=2930091 RepID=UPI003FA6FD7B